MAGFLDHIKRFTFKIFKFSIFLKIKLNIELWGGGKLRMKITARKKIKNGKIVRKSSKQYSKRRKITKKKIKIEEINQKKNLNVVKQKSEQNSIFGKKSG